MDRFVGFVPIRCACRSSLQTEYDKGQHDKAEHGTGPTAMHRFISPEFFCPSFYFFELGRNCSQIRTDQQETRRRTNLKRLALMRF
jgi:hypothetical protein